MQYRVSGVGVKPSRCRIWGALGWRLRVSTLHPVPVLGPEASLVHADPVEIRVWPDEPFSILSGVLHGFACFLWCCTGRYRAWQSFAGELLLQPKPTGADTKAYT